MLGLGGHGTSLAMVLCLVFGLHSEDFRFSVCIERYATGAHIEWYRGAMDTLMMSRVPLQDGLFWSWMHWPVFGMF